MKYMILATTALLCSIAGHSQQSFMVYFDFDKSALTQETRARLDSFCEAQRQNLSRMSIDLHGHCDAKGSDGYNDQLSKRRVAAVKRFFKEYGLKEVNIGDEAGHGKRQPVNENISDDDRRLNRRVEIRYREIYPPGMTRIGPLKEEIADSTVKAGTNIVLRNINFEGGRHQFLPESIPMLDELLDAMRSFPNLVIRVEGHICCHEDETDGLDQETGLMNLSAARARAVMDYLISNNIKQERVSSIGYGHKYPLYAFPERTEEEKMLNRRVEIKIISK